jgi:hypothetical protein
MTIISTGFEEEQRQDGPRNRSKAGLGPHGRNASDSVKVSDIIGPADGGSMPWSLHLGAGYYSHNCSD